MAEKERLLRQSTDAIEMANDLEAMIRAPDELGPPWNSEDRVELLIMYQKARESHRCQFVAAQEQEALAAVERA